MVGLLMPSLFVPDLLVAGLRLPVAVAHLLMADLLTSMAALFVAVAVAGLFVRDLLVPTDLLVADLLVHPSHM
eukprot:CAMPEP_0119464968 /NCGR_PEP_ID=MMETSP1344-20130328/317_1 /TAXON_ID=236787 /ORGANISM="Florenciella parvula, Strain CCMP2471" /LENGTH=72 /DNA_ID=CAMNT_0007497209 /DNA_START=497 /DNA_END=715 /DNA_ORIENTATION=+